MGSGLVIRLLVIAVFVIAGTVCSSQAAGICGIPGDLISVATWAEGGGYPPCPNETGPDTGCGCPKIPGIVDEDIADPVSDPALPAPELQVPIPTLQVTRTYPYVLAGSHDEITLALDRDTRLQVAGTVPRFSGNRTAYYLAYLDNARGGDAVRDLADHIRKKTPSGDDRVRIAISLVQNIPYDTKDLTEPPHRMLLPYEVLYENTGVCGEKSLLLAALLRELGYGSALMEFPLQHHMAVGIRSPEQHTYNNTGYAFIETTRPEITTYSEGTYGYAGRLTSPVLLVPVSSGRSFNTIAVEAMDADRYDRIISGGPRVSRMDYLQWQDLLAKYGMDQEDA